MAIPRTLACMQSCIGCIVLACVGINTEDLSCLGLHIVSILERICVVEAAAFAGEVK